MWFQIDSIIIVVLVVTNAKRILKLLSETNKENVLDRISIELPEMKSHGLGPQQGFGITGR